MRQLGLRQPNYPLLFGLLLAGLFIFVAIFGPRIAPNDPMEEMQVVKIDGQWHGAPYRPGELEQFPLGSDPIGRDVLSRLLWAVRPTMVLAIVVVAVRMSIGMTLGLLAGWYRGPVERAVDVLTGVALAIPLLVFAIAAISYIGSGLYAFIFGLSLTGWAETASFVKGRTLAIVGAPYIEGAEAVGVRPRRILVRHVLPQLWPVLPALLAFELAAVTLIVAELGFLGIFFGGATVYGVPMSDSGGFFMMSTDGVPELGQLVADFWRKIIMTPWIPFFAGTTIFLQIFAFNLLGEGLRQHMDITRPRRSLRAWLLGNERIPSRAEPVDLPAATT